MLQNFIGVIPEPWMVASFSGLTSNITSHQSIEPINDDTYREINLNLMIDEEQTGLFSFPKGAAAGLFFHDLLEHIDFTQTHLPQTGDLISSMLAKHEFETK